MANQLTSHENQFLKEFIKKSERISQPPKYLFLYTSIFSLLGMILFTSAIILTVNNLNNRVVFYVFVPGLLGGIGIIVTSLLILKHFKNVTTRKKLAIIIKKLT